MHTWSIVFLVASLAGFLLAGILIRRFGRQRKNWPVIFLVFGFAVILLQYVFYWNGTTREKPYLYFFDHSWYLAFGPLLYHYLLRFYNRRTAFSWWHYTPALISLLLNGYYFIHSDGFTIIDSQRDETLFYFFQSFRSPWVAGISLMIYTFACNSFVVLGKGDDKNAYQLIRRRWAKLLVGLFGLFTLAYLSYFTLVRFEFFNPNWDYAISAVMTLSIFGVGFFVFTMPQIFNGELFHELFGKDDQSPARPDRDQELSSALYQKLIDHIRRNKPYRHNELRLSHIAGDLGLSTHRLSRLINNQSGENFNQFINQYRLEEARELLAETQMPVRAIYYEVGFNNKATFYAAFRSRYNCTPTQFRNDPSRS